jgi:hypothetical protein
MVRYDLDSTLSNLINRYRLEINIHSYIDPDMADKTMIAISNIQKTVTGVMTLPIGSEMRQHSCRIESNVPFEISLQNPPMLGPFTVFFGKCPHCSFPKNRFIYLFRNPGKTYISCLECIKNRGESYYKIGWTLKSFESEVGFFLNSIRKACLTIVKNYFEN